MHSVSVTFIQLFPDCLQDSNDIAYVLALILYTHVDNTSLIGNAVEFSMNLYPAFPEDGPDIPRENDIGTPVVCDFVNDSIEVNLTRLKVACFPSF